MKGQKTDVVGLDAKADFLRRRLCAEMIWRGDKDE
jgi:hypothetical protein